MYLLLFAFYHSMHAETFPRHRYTSLAASSPGKFRACHVFEFGIHVLLQDMKAAVAAWVRADVNAQVQEGGHSPQTKARIGYLEEWEDVGVDEGQFSCSGPKFQELCKAVTNTDRNFKSLPGIGRAPIQPYFIGEMLYAKGSKPPTPTGRPSKPTGAPLLQGGAFNKLLPSFIKLLCQQMAVEQPTEAIIEEFSWFRTCWVCHRVALFG